MASTPRFEEKIIYKCHQHWIIPAGKTMKYTLFIAIPFSILSYFVVDYSWMWTFLAFVFFTWIITLYQYYLWHHSWLFIGNQKITLSVRNGIFSQFAMNIRYRNIRDSAVSKHSALSFLLKYGTLFIRSSANEWDFQAHYVPKVGKIYALVNALSRYNDDERSDIDSIESLHAHHTKNEFSTVENWIYESSVEKNLEILKFIPWISEAIELSDEAREYIMGHEEARNHGIYDVLKRKHILCFIHDSSFRDPAWEIVIKNNAWESYFPSVPFPEVEWKDVVSSSPSEKIHSYLLQFFPYSDEGSATVLVGWNEI